MADYNPNQFEPGGHKPYERAGIKSWEEHAVTREQALEARVLELEAEVKKLKGVKTYTIDVTTTVQYTVEATDEAGAKDWYFEVGRMTVPTNRGTAIVNVKEKND